MVARAAQHDVSQRRRSPTSSARSSPAPAIGGRAQIRAYLGKQLDGLGGAFDFPLMWAARDAVAHDAAGGFAMLEHEIAAGAQAWSGSGATIAHMIGNHDTTRFLSEAAGDAAAIHGPRRRRSRPIRRAVSPPARRARAHA